MNDAPRPARPTDAPHRRVGDGAAPVAPVAADDPEAWYQALRSGARPAAEIAHRVPLDVIFAWYSQRRLSETEFADLMAAHDVQEVRITDLATAAAVEDAEKERAAALAAAFKSRLAALDLSAKQDSVSEDDLRAVLDASQPLPEGVGIRLVFVSPATPPEGANPLPEAGARLIVSLRAYGASASIRSAVKCEALLACPALPGEVYCRVVLPLPVIRGGRRRLFVSVLDNETRQPLKLPPPVAELFQEKYIEELLVLRASSTEAGGRGLGDLVRGTLGRLLGR